MPLLFVFMPFFMVL